MLKRAILPTVFSRSVGIRLATPKPRPSGSAATLLRLKVEVPSLPKVVLRSTVRYPPSGAPTPEVLTE